MDRYFNRQDPMLLWDNCALGHFKSIQISVAPFPLNLNGEVNTFERFSLG